MDDLTMIAVCVWLIGTFLVAMFGETRKIGFGGALAISVFLSPVIGLIAVLCSKDLQQAKLEYQALRKINNGSAADELTKLAALKESGTLTESEFEAQKAKILE